MDKLGGFDKRYANGIAYDDMELVKRIEFLGLRKTISNDVSVLHQWHPKIYDNMINVIEKRKINRMLFDNVTCKDGKFKVN